MHAPWRGISRRRHTGDVNGGGPHLQVETEGTDPVWGVQRGDGGRICGGSQDDTSWANGRGVTDLENLGRKGRAADLSNGLTVQGRPVELPSGGVPGPSGDEDGNAGSLPIPACPGYRGHSGGGKPPPPKVHPMQHAGPLTGTERHTP